MSTTPSSIGRYEIVRRLGEGGMGAVYLARDPLIERQIAVKLLREGLENDELRERFVREARSAGRLQHVNIVVIFDVGDQLGRPYIAMEYVEGDTIADMVRRRDAMALPQKIRLLEQLCEGLAFAHRAGIVHRDIKPANLIVSRDGVLKILDFGIARLGQAGLTMAGVMLGTLNYMSPEQVTGTEVDRRSDIFAVGAVCYEFLSNTRAFPGDLQDGILHRILSHNPPALDGVCPGIDPRVVQIVNKALEKDPARRYQGLEALQADLVAVRESLAPSTNGGQTRTPVVVTPSETSAHTGPPTSVTGQRTVTGREQATRFRTEQIEHWLEIARAATARGDHAEVLKACQQVFVMDPDNTTAVDLSDRARRATDERQIAEHVGQATDLLARGALDDASRIVKLALALDPASPAAIRTRLAIDEARRAREQETARRQAIDSAMQGAESAYSVSSYDTALRKLDEVLSIDRAHGRARSLRDEVLDAIEQRRRLREAEDKARAAVAEAWEWYDRGDFEAAFALLEAATPSHELIANALGELRRLQGAANASSTTRSESGGGTDFEKTMVIPVPAGGRGRPAPGQPPTESLPTIVGPAVTAQPFQAFDLDSTVLVQPLRIPPAREALVSDAKTASTRPTATGPMTAPAAEPGARPATSAPQAESPVVAAPPPVAAVPAPVKPGAQRPTSAVPGSAPKKRGALIVVGVLLAVGLVAGGIMTWSRFRAPTPQPGEEPVAAQPAAQVPAQPAQTATTPPVATPETQTGIVPPVTTEAAPAAAATATPATQPKRRKAPGPEPVPVMTPQPSEPAVPAPVAPIAPHGTLVVESDTPGASVFVDGNPLGTAPVRSSSLSQGEHELRASLEGEEDITRRIDIGSSGETSVILRFKEARLRVGIQVVHKHGGGGSCEGKLSATLAGITYDTPNRNDAFSLTFPELERFQMDLPTKTLTIKRQGGRTWNFTDRNAQPDELARFHFQVSRARQKLAAQGR